MSSVPAFMLLLTIMMPGNQPDKVWRHPEATLADCWKDAQEFVAHKEDVLAHANLPDALGVAAACAAGSPTTSGAANSLTRHSRAIPAMPR